MNTNQDFKVNGKTYRRLSRKCGKPGCKCNTPGQEHGPYWYAFSDVGTPKYIGKELPAQVINHVTLLKKSGAKLKAIKEKVRDRLDKARDALKRAERELDTVRALEAGEYTASEVLKSLGLAEFNGHGE
jgi:hypothetical protein